LYTKGKLENEKWWFYRELFTGTTYSALISWNNFTGAILLIQPWIEHVTNFYAKLSEDDHMPAVARYPSHWHDGIIVLLI